MIKTDSKIQVFFSYSHKDERMRDNLEKHLSMLKKEDVIDGWHDRKITAGNEWKGDIDKNLKSAKIILLLISADFLDSAYCYDEEMKTALAQHDSGKSRVIPIILRRCDWKHSPFQKLQALPLDGKPVTDWKPQNNGYHNITEGIRRAIQEMTGSLIDRVQYNYEYMASIEKPHDGDQVSHGPLNVNGTILKRFDGDLFLFTGSNGRYWPSDKLTPNPIDGKWDGRLNVGYNKDNATITLAIVNHETSQKIEKYVQESKRTNQHNGIQIEKFEQILIVIHVNVGKK